VLEADRGHCCSWFTQSTAKGVPQGFVQDVEVDVVRSSQDIEGDTVVSQGYIDVAHGWVHTRVWLDDK